jgi:hypothetical protein
MSNTWRQFQIEDATTEDEQLAVSVVSGVANRYSLADTKDSSRVPLTLLNYSEKIGFGFGLGARRVGSFLVVDFNPRNGASELYGSVLSEIADALRLTFGERFRENHSDKYIEIPLASRQG